jgi:hypothetical protein
VHGREAIRVDKLLTRIGRAVDCLLPVQYCRVCYGTSSPPLGRQDPATRIQHAQKHASAGSVVSSAGVPIFECVLCPVSSLLPLLTWIACFRFCCLICFLFAVLLFAPMCMCLPQRAAWRVQLGYCSLFQSASRSLSFRLLYVCRKGEERKEKDRQEQIGKSPSSKMQPRHATSSRVSRRDETTTDEEYM